MGKVRRRQHNARSGNDVAGIDRVDGRGRVVDFHALRGTFATRLAVAGVSLRYTQSLMRHSDPRLTANVYQDAGCFDLRESVEALRDISVNDADHATALQLLADAEAVEAHDEAALAPQAKERLEVTDHVTAVDTKSITVVDTESVVGDDELAPQADIAEPPVEQNETVVADPPAATHKSKSTPANLPEFPKGGAREHAGEELGVAGRPASYDEEVLHPTILANVDLRGEAILAWLILWQRLGCQPGQIVVHDGELALRCGRTYRSSRRWIESLTKACLIELRSQQRGRCLVYIPAPPKCEAIEASNPQSYALTQLVDTLSPAQRQTVTEALGKCEVAECASAPDVEQQEAVAVYEARGTLAECRAIVKELLQDDEPCNVPAHRERIRGEYTQRPHQPVKSR